MAFIPPNAENTEIFDFLKLGQDCEQVAIMVYQTCTNMQLMYPGAHAIWIFENWLRFQRGFISARYSTALSLQSGSASSLPDTAEPLYLEPLYFDSSNT